MSRKKDCLLYICVCLLSTNFCPNQAIGLLTPEDKKTSTISTKKTVKQSKLKDNSDKTTKSADSKLKASEKSTKQEAKNAQNVNGLISQGFGQIEKGEFNNAIKSLCVAINESKDNVLARRYLAYSLLQQGYVQSAKKQLIYITHMETPTAFDWYLMGQTYFQETDMTNAEAAFRNAMFLQPDLCSARVGLIKCLLATNHKEEAFMLLTEGLKQTQDPQIQAYYRSTYELIQNSSNKEGSNNPTNIYRQ